MRHVIVKLWPGKSEQQKTRLAEQMVKDIVAILNCGKESVSVAIEQIKQNKWDKLYEKPGYNPFE